VLQHGVLRCSTGVLPRLVLRCRHKCDGYLRFRQFAHKPAARSSSPTCSGGTAAGHSVPVATQYNTLHHSDHIWPEWKRSMQRLAGIVASIGRYKRRMARRRMRARARACCCMLRGASFRFFSCLLHVIPRVISAITAVWRHRVGRRGASPVPRAGTNVELGELLRADCLRLQSGVFFHGLHPLPDRRKDPICTIHHARNIHSTVPVAHRRPRMARCRHSHVGRVWAEEQAGAPCWTPTVHLLDGHSAFRGALHMTPASVTTIHYLYYHAISSGHKRSCTNFEINLMSQLSTLMKHLEDSELKEHAAARRVGSEGTRRCTAYTWEVKTHAARRIQITQRRCPAAATRRGWLGPGSARAASSAHHDVSDKNQSGS
jgi:hypothetical protein